MSSLSDFPNGVTSFGMPVLGGGGFMTTGNVFFVDDSGTDSGAGDSPDAPYKTLDYAIGKCTASHGDIIFVKEGHAETVTTAITADVVGITIIGLGHGDNRPTITVNAAIPGINVTAADVKFANLRIIAGSGVTAASRLVRIAASQTKFIGCQFEMAYDMYHLMVLFSGDDAQILNCTFINNVTTSASVHPQRAILNISATNALIKGCRFNDCKAKKAERWRTVIAGGALGSNTVVSDCEFIVRGISTATRAAGASDGTGVQAPNMATLYCRAISPSANTSAGANYTSTFQYMIESYDVAAVNKKALLGATTSDLRLKTKVAYL
jgi:hypothetical protein